MKTTIDSTRKIVSIQYADVMPPRIVAWRPVLGCVQLPVGATEDALRFVPQVAVNVVRPDLDAQDWPTGDQNAAPACRTRNRKHSMTSSMQAFDGKTYGGHTWGIIVVKDGKIVAERYAMGFDMHRPPNAFGGQELHRFSWSASRPGSTASTSIAPAPSKSGASPATRVARSPPSSAAHVQRSLRRRRRQPAVGHLLPAAPRLRTAR